MPTCPVPPFCMKTCLLEMIKFNVSGWASRGTAGAPSFPLSDMQQYILVVLKLQYVQKLPNIANI